MGKAAAKMNDAVTGADTHEAANGAVNSHTFSGIINHILSLSTNVKINGQLAATIDSEANVTSHDPALETGGQTAKITSGSTSVKINSKGVARSGDAVKGCSTAKTQGEKGTVSDIPQSNVFIGD